MDAARIRQKAIGTPWLLIGMALALIVGCVGENYVGEWRGSVKRGTPAFSHKRHVVEEDMECAACHKDAETADKAGMPAVKSCMKCHESIDEKKTPEHRIAAFVKDEKPQWSDITLLPEETKFSHKVHAEAKVQCASCHKGIKASTAITASLRVTMKECQSCHAKTGVGGNAPDNCAVCHTSIGKDTKPKSHERNWKELHGRDIGFLSHGSPWRCELCHTRQSCDQCHRNELPKSHNNFWRLRGHGVVADVDRSRCRVCHTEDSCERCHRETAPANHRGNWEDNHCLSCHFPLKDSACFVCHKSTPSHSAAPRLPGNNTHRNATANDCRTCHFGLRLRHVDNGTSCLQCHQR